MGIKVSKFARWATRLALAATGLAAGTAMGQAQQPFPSRPITWINGFGPGSSADVINRLMVPEATKNLGQTVVLDYRPNLKQTVQATMNARGQAYIVTNVANSTIIFETLRDPGFNIEPGKDYTAVMAGYLGPYFLVVSSAADQGRAEPYRYSKANRGKLNFAAGSPAASGFTPPPSRDHFDKPAWTLTAIHTQERAGMFQSVAVGETHVGLFSGRLQTVHRFRQVDGPGCDFRAPAVPVLQTLPTAIKSACPTITQLRILGGHHLTRPRCLGGRGQAQPRLRRRHERPRMWPSASTISATVLRGTPDL